MKLLLPTLCLAAGLGLTFGFVTHAQDGGDPPAKPPVEALLDRVQALEAELSGLKKGQAELEVTLTAVVTYLDQRADAALQMSKSLDIVEAKGFTAGINPNSRELLLSSWRAFLAAEGATLPKLVAPEDEQPAPGKKPPGR
ncbi:MAG: hypothetical protein WD226_04050 [Planctomycetota bacterium]